MSLLRRLPPQPPPVDFPKVERKPADKPDLSGDVTVVPTDLFDEQEVYNLVVIMCNHGASEKVARKCLNSMIEYLEINRQKGPE